MLVYMGIYMGKTSKIINRLKKYLTISETWLKVSYGPKMATFGGVCFLEFCVNLLEVWWFTTGEPLILKCGECFKVSQNCCSVAWWTWYVLLIGLIWCTILLTHLSNLDTSDNANSLFWRFTFTCYMIIWYQC